MLCYKLYNRDVYIRIVVIAKQARKLDGLYANNLLVHKVMILDLEI